MIKTFLTLFFSIFMMISCGTEQPVPVEPAPSPNPNPNPNPNPGDKTSFARVSQIHDQYCIQCHSNSGFIRSESALKNSSAKSRVQNGSMPPPNAQNKMPSNIREEYLNFFIG